MWKQDEDINDLNLIESPYKILVAPAGTYSIKGKTRFTKVDEIFGVPIYTPLSVTTNIDTIIVEGGKVKIY